MICENLRSVIDRLQERSGQEQNEIAALILDYLDGDFILGDLSEQDLQGVKDTVRAITDEYA
jgi:hypothetical protein